MTNVERLDLNAMPMIHRMSTTGLQVDLSHFHKMERILQDDMDAITEKVHDLTGYYINLDSGDQVSDLLFKKLKLKQARVVMTKSGDRESVENEVLVAIQHDHPVVPEMLLFKEYSKLKGTYVVPMPKLAKRTQFGVWRMYPNFGGTFIPSGRLNCREPNLLAMPNRSKRGRQVCEGFITTDGWSYLSVDESQIEPRLAAHLSQDPELLRIYHNEEDIYSDFATSAFKLPDHRYECYGYGNTCVAFDGQSILCDNHEHKDHGWHYPTVDKKKHRSPAKTCILASIYDVTGQGLLEQMPIVCKNCDKESTLHDCRQFAPLWNENNCQDLINKFGIRYAGVIRDRIKAHRTVRKHGLIWDMWGRILHCAAVRSTHDYVVAAALREAGNFPYQCINPESLVFVQGEGRKLIGDLVGRQVTLWDGLQWSTGDVVTTGVKKQYQITLNNGLQLKCSPDHKVKTVSTKGNPTWKTVDELRSLSKSARVSISYSISEWDWLNNIYPECNYKSTDKNPQSSIQWAAEDPDLFGEMLGRIASDGSLIRSSRDGNPKCVYILVAEHEYAILPRLLSAAHRTNPAFRTSEQKRGNYRPLTRIEIGSRGLTETFLQWGLKEKIPDLVWKSSRLLRSYLRGMFDGDGGIVNRECKWGGTVQLTFGANNGRMSLARDIQSALLMLGIRTRFRAKPHSIRIAIQQKDLHIFRTLIGFMNPKKNEALSSILNFKEETAAYGRAVGIKSIVQVDDCTMVDFVDSTTGSFCADGFVVHNSGAQGTIKLTMAQVEDDFVDMEVYGDVVNPLLQIHDELLFECRNDMLEEIGYHVAGRFENCVQLTVPIKASVATAINWGSMPK